MSRSKYQLRLQTINFKAHSAQHQYFIFILFLVKGWDLGRGQGTSLLFIIFSSIKNRRRLFPLLLARTSLKSCKKQKSEGFLYPEARHNCNSLHSLYERKAITRETFWVDVVPIILACNVMILWIFERFLWIFETQKLSCKDLLVEVKTVILPIFNFVLEMHMECKTCFTSRYALRSAVSFC